MRDPKIVINKIKSLLDELGGSIGIKIPRSKTTGQATNTPISQKGALGAIFMLIDESFFDTPKRISEIMERLEEIGHYHKRTAVAMNLLNLTKRRILNRFKNKETKNWEYVIRK